MIQRKCGTCRHFEPGGIASSGWCRHPDRQDLEQMVLVRKSELACRNGWDQDLWEPIASENGRVPHGDAVARAVPTSEPAERERARLAARPRPDDATSAQPAPGSGSRPETAPPPARPAQRAGVSSPADDVARRAAEKRPWPDPPRRPLGEPERAWPAFPRSGEAETHPPSNRLAPPPARTSPLRQDRQIPPRPVADLVVEEQARREPSWRARPGWGAIPEEPSRENARGAYTPARAPSGPSPVSIQSGSTEPFAIPPSPTRPSVEAPVTPPAPLSTPASDERRPEKTVDELEPPVESRPERTAAAPPSELSQIPRCCATCRDFRPAEGGERGWCNNRYAFNHRQMVSAGDLACAGTIGFWWTPADDWWMQRADISHHGRPTPIVDEYLHRMLEGRSGARRRQAR